MPQEPGDIPNPITLEVWEAYAENGQIDLLDAYLVTQIGYIPPEVFSSAHDSQIGYAEDLRKYLVEDYKFGEDKLKDMYVLRRIAMGLSEAKTKFEDGNSSFTDLHDFEMGIVDGFGVLVDKYSSKYWEDLGNPKLFISIFEPVMKVLSEEEAAKAIRTYAGEGVEEIMKIFRERNPQLKTQEGM